MSDAIFGPLGVYIILFFGNFNVLSQVFWNFICSPIILFSFIMVEIW